MENSFTKTDIKDSVECQWRFQHIKLLLCVYLIIVIVSLFIPIGLIVKYGIHFSSKAFLPWLCSLLACGLLFLSFILYYAYKRAYLIKNYENFPCYEVTLNNISTSYAYKGSIYYTVTIDFEGESKMVDTNPYFSSFFSKFSPKEYNGKTVIGLYDSNLEKFYIIKKVN